MGLAKSALYLLLGIVKRIYYVIPPLLLDPFDLVNRLSDFEYDPPVWITWLLFGVGVYLAVALTYHEMRMKVVALEPVENWIKKYQKRNKRLPSIPEYLLPVVNNYVLAQPISRDIEIITPSGQFWNKLLPSQREQLIQLVEWLGQDSRDYLSKMKQMLPPT